MNAIEARGLTKRFGSFVAVDHIDLEVRAGELFGLLGPNGAGKTTLVRMLTGLLPITSGQARVAGIDVARQQDDARVAMGVVPQALTSDLDLTGWENLDIYGRFFGVSREVRRTRGEELLRSVGLWDRRNELVKTYSGGMRRRLEIARGLLHRPRVLFLDEPTIGLDPQSRRVIWDLLRNLRHDGDLTISLTTHYLDEADALCDRIAIIDQGRIIALGTPSDLKASVPGSDTVTLTLAAALPAATSAELTKMPGVRGLRGEGTTELVIHADGGSELLPRLLERLRTDGIAVHAIALSRITLEDTFMYFTGRSLHGDRAA